MEIKLAKCLNKEGWMRKAIKSLARGVCEPVTLDLKWYL